MAVPPYTYSWNGGVSGSTVSGLSAGNYTVTVMGSKGCTSTSTATIIPPPPLIGQLTKGTANCNGCGCKEWLMITASGRTSPYSYSWRMVMLTDQKSALPRRLQHKY
ncbi:MAG: PKD domain-containing protein [Bacteroidetes bacterium]|nr:PKD domain-containing protein [Bacteroidota bacterium]